VTQLTRRNVLLLAVVMAAATTFVAYLFLTRQQVRALDREDKTATQTMVVVARQEVRPLQLLHGDWFAVKQVRVDGVPRDAVATPADLNGKVALVNMTPGQIVTERQVAAKSSDLGLAYSVKPPLRAVTVALDPIIGVAGFPKPGNHVDVLATFATDYGMVTRTVLQDVEILALGSEVQPKEVDPNTGKTSAAREQPTATLAVLPGEAEKLILAENRGKLQLALRAAEDSTYRSHTGSREVVVTGFTPQPKNGVPSQVAVTKTPPASLPPAAEQTLRDAERLIKEAQTHPAPPPPVLPPVSAPLAGMQPAPAPEAPTHVITVVRGATTEKVLIKSDRKSARSRRTEGADAGSTTLPAMPGGVQ
jgi:pilus assembly protein CpaB